MLFFQKKPKIVLILSALLFLLPYGFSIIWPKTFWGFHSIAFLPAPWPILLLSFASLIWLLLIYRPLTLSRAFTFPLSGMRWLVMILFSGMMGFLFYKFPIYQDFYGDSLFIKKQIDLSIKNWDPLLLSNLIRIDFSDPKFGTDSVYALVNLVTYLISENGQEALRWIDAISGALYVLIWMQLLRTEIQEGGLRLLLGLMGISAPFLLVFMGHMEVYAPSLVLMLGFLSTLLAYFRNRKKIFILLAWILFFLNLKFHVTSFLLLPALGLASLYALKERFPTLQNVFNWKVLSKWVLAPIFVLGLILYFPITESHFGERSYTSDTLTDALFLPLNSSESAPLDRYNLLSGSHLFDYFNQMFLWSGPALYLLTFIGFQYRKQINWQEPTIILLGLSLILYFCAFFVLNPLLSMPMDWDLFSLPAPLLLVFVLLLCRSLQKSSLSRQVGGGIIALCLMSLPVFIINTQRAPLSHRLESIGIRMFETYWIGASTLINEGINLEQNHQTKLERRLAMLERLKPIAISGNDVEYADILCETGKLYFRVQQYPDAQPYFEEAFTYSPNLVKNTYYLVVNHFSLQQYSEAHSYLPRLVAYQYPNQIKANAIAVHVSLEAEQYIDAAKYASICLKLSPDNQTMQQVLDRISKKENLSEIKYLFRQK